MTQTLRSWAFTAVPQKAFKLFAKDDSIKTAEDLKGKKVAGPKGTILHELLVSYLNNAGMTEDDIEFMAMGIPDARQLWQVEV